MIIIKSNLKAENIHNKYLHTVNNKRGLAMPLAVLIVLVVTILTGVMTKALNNEFLTRAKAENMIVAKYLAEAGIEHGITAIKNEMEIILNHNSFNETDYNNSPLIISNNELDGYNLSKSVVTTDSKELGSYKYNIVDGLLDFDIYERILGIDANNNYIVEYKADLRNRNFILNSEAVSGTDKYMIEAEIKFDYYTMGNIAAVEYVIVKWFEHER